MVWLAWLSQEKASLRTAEASCVWQRTSILSGCAGSAVMVWHSPGSQLWRKWQGESTESCQAPPQSGAALPPEPSVQPASIATWSCTGGEGRGTSEGFWVPWKKITYNPEWSSTAIAHYCSVPKWKWDSQPLRTVVFLLPWSLSICPLLTTSNRHLHSTL